MNYKSTFICTIAALSIGHSRMSGQTAFAKDKSLDKCVESMSTQFDADYSWSIPFASLSASMDKKVSSKYGQYVMNGSAQVQIPLFGFNVAFRTYMIKKDSEYIPTHFFMYELDGKKKAFKRSDSLDISKEFGSIEHFTDYKHLIFDKEKNTVYDVLGDSTISIDDKTTDVLSAFLNIAQRPRDQPLKLLFFDGTITSYASISRENFEGVEYIKIGANLVPSHAKMKSGNFLRNFNEIYVLIDRKTMIPEVIVGDTDWKKLHVTRDKN